MIKSAEKVDFWRFLWYNPSFAVRWVNTWNNTTSLLQTTQSAFCPEMAEKPTFCLLEVQNFFIKISSEFMLY